MHFDDDLMVLLRQLSSGQIPEAQAQQIIVRLVLELQNARQLVRVTKQLNPPGSGPSSKEDINRQAGGVSKLTPSVADTWFGQRDARIGQVEKKG